MLRNIGWRAYIIIQVMHRHSPLFHSFHIGIGRIWSLGGLLHVYDFMEGWDTSRETAEPTKHETYSGRKYLTTYLKQQKVSFGAISVDRNGVPDSYSGNAVIGEGYASVLDEEAVLKYTFEVPTAGTYDVAVEIVYPR